MLRVLICANIDAPYAQHSSLHTRLHNCLASASVLVSAPAGRAVLESSKGLPLLFGSQAITADYSIRF